ncbi:hypothetical protein DFJ73DRAFT_776728 [Zopfochytrium polystomum]|nr:hypothetical protein DFJ73DRAFT_776728 [Zopfochytrium polystomum]
MAHSSGSSCHQRSRPSTSKEKTKLVEDKTFGLKNKNKSAKVGKYVQQVKSQVEASGNPKAKKEAEDRKAAIANKKAAEEARKAELAELFKPVQSQKVPFGVDPKTIVCAFFKSGACLKGNKCKFSHDLNVERKGAKIDVYTDSRAAEKAAKEADTMENWDEAKLQQVVKQKQDSANANLPTEIVCKHFLEAIETRKYGWFWECPSGGKSCKYRHALPPGYVLKKRESEAERREREAEEKENAITFEEFLDEERHKLGPNLTPITDATFAAWKESRKARQQQEQEALAKEKLEAFKKQRAGMRTGMALSGRELFDFNPELAKADAGDEDGAMEFYEREDQDDEQPATEAVQGGGVQSSLKGKRKEEGNVTVAVVNEELFDANELDGLDDDDDEEGGEDEDDDDEESRRRLSAAFRPAGAQQQQRQFLHEYRPSCASFASVFTPIRSNVTTTVAGWKLNAEYIKITDPKKRGNAGSEAEGYGRNITDPKSFLTAIGRGCGELADKFTSWEHLFQATSSEMKAAPMSLPTDKRKYILQWREWFKRGRAPEHVRIPKREKAYLKERAAVRNARLKRQGLA